MAPIPWLTPSTYWQHVLEHPAEHRSTYELVDVLAEASDVSWSVRAPVTSRYMTSLIDGLTLIYVNEGDSDKARAALELGVTHMVSLAQPT